MDGMATGPLKPRLLSLVAQGRAQQQAFIARLSAAERAAQGAPGAWAAKDHIAHNTAWIADAARLIAAAARGETPAPSPDETEFNPRVFAAQQHQPWDAVLSEAMQAGEALRAALEACSEADLGDSGRFPWREGRPLWTEAFVSGYDHPVEHYVQFYLEAGDAARAGAVLEEAVETARRLIGETEPFGYIVYKLGSFYAQSGQAGLALAALRQALARAPRLRDWSREDIDLVSLHADPAFQALVTEAGVGGSDN